MDKIQAIYSDGLFLPMNPFDVPDDLMVEQEPRELTGEEEIQNSIEVFAILSRSHATGAKDLAERHNDYRP